MSDAPVKEVESQPVQLARIEGKIDLIKYQGEVFAADLTIVKSDVAKLKTDVHTLQLNEVARDKLAATVAVTLKESDAALIVKNEQKWTPLTRLYAIAATASILLSIWMAFNK